MIEYGPAQVIQFTYTNHRGVTRVRRVVPIEIRWKKVEPYYPEFCWLLKCWDVEREIYRDFQVTKIRDLCG